MSDNTEWYTTEAQVESILDHSLDTGDLLDAFIETAHQMVVDNLLTSNYSEAKLELIERWLSAHLYAVAQRPDIQSEHADGAGETYAIPSGGEMLNQTKYGRQALLLDNRGKLAALSKKIESGRIKVVAGYMGRISEKSDLKTTETDMDMDIQQ